MIERVVTITNPLGLHTRPAARFVAAASAFESSIRIAHGAQTVNGKSIMGLMILAVKSGSQIRISVDGPDEDIALERLVRLIREELNRG